MWLVSIFATFGPEGGLVVDPFCGSGVTAVEALTNRRRTVFIDLDPLAVNHGAIHQNV